MQAFAAQIMTSSHRSVLSGVNSVGRATIRHHGWHDSNIGPAHHLLVIFCMPVAMVAFGGKFWSMQNDCGGSLFGFFFGLAAFRFFKARKRKPKMAKAKRRTREEMP